MTSEQQQTMVEALAFAQDLADEVGRRLMSHFGEIAEASLKGDGSLVTHADLEADRFITEAIRGRYPDHDIVSEELNTVYPGRPWCWIVDPIDGTTNFTRGVPVWGISIALALDGWPVMGLIDLPPLRVRYHAVRGGGAFENGQPITVRPSVDLTDPHQLQNDLFAVCSQTVERYLVDTPLKLRVMGSAAYNFCLAAAGTTVAALDMRPKVWDMAAGWLLVHEAGGVVVQLKKEEPIFPLVAGRDYRAYPRAQLSAPNKAVAHYLIERIRRVR